MAAGQLRKGGQWVHSSCQVAFNASGLGPSTAHTSRLTRGLPTRQTAQDPGLHRSTVLPLASILAPTPTAPSNPLPLGSIPTRRMFSESDIAPPHVNHIYTIIIECAWSYPASADGYVRYHSDISPRCRLSSSGPKHHLSSPLSKFKSLRRVPPSILWWASSRPGVVGLGS